ncbi:MAG: branched-chain amino acid ABC transporter permease [Chloroflexi bacterium CFX4]|nr:branched-chain amino acid ABC transporter permease [Chloroflexi bacterium CFX4]MDL1922511.1 branched-chain amino acid ABC transporter permease [Chloroflexi bacterium CFX3]
MSANIRPSGVFDTTYTQEMRINRTRFDQILSAGFLGVILLLPLLSRSGPFGIDLVQPGFIGTVERIAILMIAVQGLNLLVGYTGQITLGQAAFMAVGAYSTAILMRGGVSFWVALPLASLFSGVVGLIFGLPSLRVKGFYLAMATLAAQFIIPWLLRNPLAPLTNGSSPLPVPRADLFGQEISGLSLYYVLIIACLLAMIVARNLIRTRTGRAFVSIRDNDVAAELLGINVFAYKLRAFFVCAVFAGLAGGLLAIEARSISPDRFDLRTSIELLAMLIIGGAGFSQAPIFGVSVLAILRETLIPGITPTLQEWLPRLLPFVDSVNINAAIAPLIFGVVIIAFLIIEPRGLAYRWEIFKISWKLRPFSY